MEPLFTEDEKHALTQTLKNLTDQENKVNAILNHPKVLQYLTDSLDAPIQTQLKDIHDDPYKAMAHSAYLYQNPPENIAMHNQALEFIQSHHENLLREEAVKSGAPTKFGCEDEKCTCEDGGITLTMFKIPHSGGAMELNAEEEEEVENSTPQVESILKPTVFIPATSGTAVQWLKGDLKRLNLNDKKYLASEDGGLGIYSKTHEFKIVPDSEETESTLDTSQ